MSQVAISQILPEELSSVLIALIQDVEDANYLARIQIGRAHV